MNGTLVNNTTQPLNIPYTLIQPVIPGKTVHIKTNEEQTVRHYDELIITIMKVMDIQYITHCTDKQYRLITIHGARDTLIYIIPSKTLQKHLLKQRDQSNSIKTRVHIIKQSMLLPNGNYHHITLNLINE